MGLLCPAAGADRTQQQLTWTIVRLLPRRAAAEPVDDDVEGAAEGAAEVSAPESKGRPTPKRRDADPRRGPVAAPKTRREAMQRQRQQAKQARKSGTALTPRERRQRVLAGDPSALPRRDAGPLRALARDYVDSRRMLSNGLLILFPLIVVSFFFHTNFVNLVILGIFIAVLTEWMITGRKIMALARQRGLDIGRNTTFGIGFYGGTRAYLPRKWRVPRAQVGLGDDV